MPPPPHFPQVPTIKDVGGAYQTLVAEAPPPFHDHLLLHSGHYNMKMCKTFMCVRGYQ